MGFDFIRTKLEGLYIIKPRVFGDDRGNFFEFYQKDTFDAAGLNYSFVQANQSVSRKGVLRGLHFQTRKPQAKLVRVISGEVFDVAVDLRENSPTYGKYVGAILSSKNKELFLIPRGFAHGFLVLSETAIFEYLADDFYDPGFEGGLAWDDPDIKIDWPSIAEIELSARDKALPTLKETKPVFGTKEGKCQLL